MNIYYSILLISILLSIDNLVILFYLYRIFGMFSLCYLFAAICTTETKGCVTGLSWVFEMVVGDR